MLHPIRQRDVASNPRDSFAWTVRRVPYMLPSAPSLAASGCRAPYLACRLGRRWSVATGGTKSPRPSALTSSTLARTAQPGPPRPSSPAGRTRWSSAPPAFRRKAPGRAGAARRVCRPKSAACLFVRYNIPPCVYRPFFVMSTSFCIFIRFNLHFPAGKAIMGYVFTWFKPRLWQCCQLLFRRS